jgi:uncharacterized membrane protein YphA (DoxX/SURF4 family)
MFYGLAKYSPQLLAVLRIVTALLFFEHGTQKLLGFPPMPAGMEAPAGMNPMMLFAGILELVGGLLIAVGFLTRPTAFILSGEMAVAYSSVMHRWGFSRPPTWVMRQSSTASSSSIWWPQGPARGPSTMPRSGIQHSAKTDSIWEGLHAVTALSR